MSGHLKGVAVSRSSESQKARQCEGSARRSHGNSRILSEIQVHSMRNQVALEDPDNANCRRISSIGRGRHATLPAWKTRELNLARSTLVEPAGENNATPSSSTWGCHNISSIGRGKHATLPAWKTRELNIAGSTTVDPSAGITGPRATEGCHKISSIGRGRHATLPAWKTRELNIISSTVDPPGSIKDPSATEYREISSIGRGRHATLPAWKTRELDEGSARTGSSGIHRSMRGSDTVADAVVDTSPPSAKIHSEAQHRKRKRRPFDDEDETGDSRHSEQRLPKASHSLVDLDNGSSRKASMPSPLPGNHSVVDDHVIEIL